MPPRGHFNRPAWAGWPFASIPGEARADASRPRDLGVGPDLAKGLEARAGSQDRHRIDGGVPARLKPVGPEDPAAPGYEHGLDDARPMRARRLDRVHEHRGRLARGRRILLDGRAAELALEVPDLCGAVICEL